MLDEKKSAIDRYTEHIESAIGIVKVVFLDIPGS
ncbi:uncharacterized protein METZ01_LOCUS111845 [marine metagenome]|uniref:Uncharacterized protein n=1 Tax=marine metagenome TaxID=408172 RepID=A0A381X3B4_9ZZZZ